MLIQSQRKIFTLLAMICLINLIDFAAAENLRLLATGAATTDSSSSEKSKSHAPHNPYSGEHH